MNTSEAKQKQLITPDNLKALTEYQNKHESLKQQTMKNTGCTEEQYENRMMEYLDL